MKGTWTAEYLVLAATSLMFCYNSTTITITTTNNNNGDRLCGLVVRVSGYKYRGPGFDPRRYQIFWVVVGLERGPISLVRSIEELLEWKKVAAPGLENRD